MTDQTASDRKILTRSKPDQFIICLHEDILGHIIYKRRYLVAFQVIHHQLKNRIGRRDQWETTPPPPPDGSPNVPHILPKCARDAGVPSQWVSGPDNDPYKPLYSLFSFPTCRTLLLLYSRSNGPIRAAPGETYFPRVRP